MERTEAHRAKQRAAQARFRAKQKELGIKRVLSVEEREWQRNYVSARRAKAKEDGIVLPSDSWWKEQPEKHRLRTARWRQDNIEIAVEMTRRNQAIRRSTPWGKITNRVWPILNKALRKGHSGSCSKYCQAMGYTWHELRGHIEKQFTPDMSWENWGDVWELDHIRPLSSFQYKSLDDPLFRECWALTNLRPLPRQENASKGAKHF